MSPLGLGGWMVASQKHLCMSPGDLVLGLREYNRGGDEWSALHRDRAVPGPVCSSWHPRRLQEDRKPFHCWSHLF